MLDAPICELIQTGKNTAKLIENNFAFSPMPSHAITNGIIATGGNERKIWNNGLKDLSMIFTLPVNMPKIIPKKLPINNPMKTLERLVVACRYNSRDLMSSIKAENTLVGGGNNILFTKPLVDMNCHKSTNIRVGARK